MSETSFVLVVDDEKDFARGLQRLLETHFRDFSVRTAASGAEALRLLAQQTFHVMLTDLRMPQMDGLELLKEALSVSPELSTIILTAFGAIETAVEALKSGAYDFLTKPVEPDQLYHVVEKGLERNRLLRENRRLKELVATRQMAMLGDSAAMRHLSHSIAAVAQTDYTVLIRGESGTGKELAARLLHASSNRAAGPFVTVNCPAIPEELLESELFGHVKGAFTSADRDRKGLFATADGGTLLLDEIGDISLAMQLKLLRVLQEGEVRPVGSSVSSPVDVRVVASTNQDLEAKVEARSFREDLYYRLNVLNLSLPPLRERKEDIPLLANFFLQQTCEEMRIKEKNLHSDVLGHLSSRSWPGNVRELQNYMRRLAVFCPGSEVTMSSVPLVEGGVPQPGNGPSGSDAQLPYKDAKARVVNDFTAGYVCSLLGRTQGNVSEAARVSGLSRVALQKILARLEIDLQQFKQS